VVHRKEISEEFAAIRSELRNARQKLGAPPLGDRQLASWRSTLTHLREEKVAKVNKRIDKFNLIVPLLNSQMFLFNLDKEAQKVLESGYEANLEEVAGEKRGEEGSAATAQGSTGSSHQSPKTLADLISRLFG